VANDLRFVVLCRDQETADRFRVELIKLKAKWAEAE
jgi:hypothetical protein